MVDAGHGEKIKEQYSLSFRDICIVAHSKYLVVFVVRKSNAIGHQKIVQNIRRIVE